MQDCISKSCIKEDNEKNSIACTDISNTIIHNNYQFSLFLSKYPIFSLRSDKETSEYCFSGKNNTEITIHSNIKHGRATIKDADLLLYCISKLRQLDYEKKAVTRRVSFTIYNYLSEIGKTISGRSYYQVIDSLQRLASTTLETNQTIEGGLKIGGGLGLIESFCLHKNAKTRRLEKIEVLLPKWLFSEILLKKIITINPQYLQLKPSQRRLYQLAKTHCHKNLPNTEFSHDYFAKKVGSLEVLRNFKSKIRKLQESQILPDFLINYKKNKIWFTLRKQDRDDADVIKKEDKVENKELKQQNVSSENALQIITQKFTANQYDEHLYNKIALRKQVAYVNEKLDRLYPFRTEAIFKSDVLSDNKIYSYLKEFGPQILFIAIRQNANFDFSSVGNPGGYFWKILKNLRK